MFGKLFAAKVRDIGITTKRLRGGDPEQRCTVVLQYDFDANLAEAIGGDAPALQKMLSAGVADGKPMKVTRSGISLDTKKVAIKFKGPKDERGDVEELEIERTLQLKAKVRQPNAENTGPMLEALVSFTIEDDDTLSFLRRNQEKLVKTRMDKAQLELPETDATAEKSAKE